MKKVVFILLLVFMTGVLFADQYVVVGMSYERRDLAWSFFFTNNELSLPNGDGYWPSLEILLNYMYENGYIFIQIERYNENSVTVIFRKLD